MRRFLGAILILTALPGVAIAQPTSLTYQGRLKNGGNLASGLHDFRFKLFDASSGGTQVGSTQCADNVPVTEGVFTTAIDFGQPFATPTGLFLEIQVRADTGLGCGNANGYTTLSPRQAITASPLANHAKSAFSLDASDGNPMAAVVVDDDGKVGFGTSTPEATLHVLANQGGATPGEGIRIQGATGGSDNLSYMSFVNGAGARIGYVGNGGGADNNVYLNSDFGDVLLYNANIGAVLTAKANGRVGIGTGQPLGTLDVRGDIRLGSSGQFRAAASEEGLRIIRGSVDTHPFDGCGATPTITLGGGFTIERQDCGTYRISFSSPFAGTPVVTTTGITVNASCPLSVAATSASSSGVTIHVDCSFNSDGGGNATWPFSFIAIGPR